jgi:hypothetical protein
MLVLFFNMYIITASYIIIIYIQCKKRYTKEHV